MRLTHSAVELGYRHGRFNISAEASARARTVLVRGVAEERVGLAEAVPSVRVVGADADQIHALLQDAAHALGRMDIGPTESPPEHPWPTAKGPAACGVDGVLLDLWGQAHDRPVWDLLGLPRAAVPTSATVSLGTPSEMAREAADLVTVGFQILKVKLGEDPTRDLPRIQAVREAVPRVPLRVDGNEGWTLDDVVALVPALAEAGVDLIEQPLPRDRPEPELRRVTAICRDHEVVHVLDEGIHGSDDAARIGEHGLADGINLKLQKAGGLRAGLRTIETARRCGLGVMVGCFIETWAGIALALQLAGSVDWVDLDGAWLLAEEPVVGAAGPFLEDGILRASTAPGIGVEVAPRFHGVFDEPTTSL